MARPKWLPPKPPDDLTNPFLVHAKSLEGQSLFAPDPKTQPWIDALREIDNDKRRDPSALVDLLKSAYPMDATARKYLADLLERYSLRAKRGEPPTPAYTESEAEQALILAVAAVRAAVEDERISVAGALEKIAKQRGFTGETLINAYYGRRRSARLLKNKRSSKTQS